MNTVQHRLSALCLACPWRGPWVSAPDAGFTQGNRQAAAFLYAGILATTTTTGGRDRLCLGVEESFSTTIDPQLGGGSFA